MHSSDGIKYGLSVAAQMIVTYGGVTAMFCVLAILLFLLIMQCIMKSYVITFSHLFILNFPYKKFILAGSLGNRSIFRRGPGFDCSVAQV